MNKTKKVISMLLIITLLITMSSVFAFAEDGSMFAYGRLKDGASKSYSFTLTKESNVTLDFINVSNPVDSGDNGIKIQHTYGICKVRVYDSNGNIKFDSPGDRYSKLDITLMYGPAKYEVKLPAGTYTVYLKEADPGWNDIKIFDYFLNLSWEEVPQTSTPSNPSNPSDGGTSGGDTSGSSNSGSTDANTPATKPTKPAKPSTSTSSGSVSSGDRLNNSSPSTYTLNEQNSLTKEEKKVVEITSTEFNESAIKSATKGEGLFVESSYGNLKFDNAALTAILNAAGEGSNITLDFREVRVADLNSTQAEKIKDVEVAMFISAQILADGKEIGDFGDGKVVVDIPFTAPEGSSIEDYTVVYIAKNGEIEVINTSYGENVLIAEFEHFSEYAIVKTSTLPTEEVVDNTAGGDGLNPVLIAGLVAVIVTGAAGGVFYYKKKATNK